MVIFVKRKGHIHVVWELTPYTQLTAFALPEPATVWKIWGFCHNYKAVSAACMLWGVRVDPLHSGKEMVTLKEPALGMMQVEDTLRFPDTALPRQFRCHPGLPNHSTRLWSSSPDKGSLNLTPFSLSALNCSPVCLVLKKTIHPLGPTLFWQQMVTVF